MKVAFDPIYAHPLPKGHRFPMLKYELIPGQLLHEGSIVSQDIFAPVPCSDHIVLLTHDRNYYERLKNQRLTEREQRHIGFPQSAQLTLREQIITQGTIDCCRYAIEKGVALNVAGGTHHAFADRGEGFCMLNDMAVAANYLLQNGMVGKILIIDLDVHQGNGTAKLLELVEEVFTFSMHGAHNYPFQKEKSTLDVPLPDGIEDQEYLELLNRHLDQILASFKPDFAFYLAGVDILSTDKFGKLKVSMEGCKKRDAHVFRKLSSLSIPCAVAMGGGYSPDIRDIVEAHCNTFRQARFFYG